MKHKNITIQEDFYNFVNKDWIIRHKQFVEKKGIINSFTLLNDKIDKEIKNVVLNKLKNNAQIVSLYDSFMVNNDELIEQHIFSLILEITEIQKSDKASLYNILEWSIKRGINQLINIVSSADQRNPIHKRIYIEEGGININDSDNYKMSLSKNKNKNTHTKDLTKNIMKYKQLLSNMFSCIFGKDNNSYNINTIIDIEKYMSPFLYPSNEARSTEKIYHLFSVNDAKNKCHLDWRKLSKRIGLLTVPREIVIENPRYTKEAMILLEKKWRSNEILVYYISQILFMASRFHSRLHGIIQDYYIIDNHIKLPSKKERAIGFICDIMNTTVNRTYLKFYENKKEIDFTKKMIECIITTYIGRLERNRWLSADTIRIAIDKLENMQITIATKPNWIEDPTCYFTKTDIFMNYMNYLEWKLHHFIETFYKPIPKNDTWLKGVDLNTYAINAEYNLNKNEMIIPNAILQPPFVDLNRPLSYNMATIGTLIGHEISHGFDNYGSLYDKNGLYCNWWKKEDLNAYTSKQILIKTFFYNVAKRDNYLVNPDLTLGENIADITGFLVSEETYINILIKNGIYGLEQRDFLISFYKNYAELWRIVMHPRLKKILYKKDTHSYAKYRVNNALVMSQHFQSIYGGDKTDNPNIVIW
jgi:putative endopeptidase